MMEMEGQGKRKGNNEGKSERNGNRSI